VKDTTTISVTFAADRAFFTASQWANSISAARRERDPWPINRVSFAAPLAVDIRTGRPHGALIRTIPLRGGLSVLGAWAIREIG